MRKTTIVIAILLLAGVATAQTMIPLPVFGRTFSATMTRGFFCQIPADITVVGLRVPDETNFTKQNVCLYRHTAAPLRFPSTSSLNPIVSKFNEDAKNIIPCSEVFKKDEYLIVIGACGDTTRLHNSYSGVTSYATTINGQPTTLLRCGIQANIITAPTPHAVWSEPSTVCRVEVYYTPGAGGFTCNASSTLSIGTKGSVDLTGGPATDFYQIAASLGNTTTINLGTCSVSLDFDGVLLYSLLVGTPYFNGYAGTLVGGAGSGTFAPPAMTSLIGVDVYHAAASYDLGGVTDCTNTVKTTLTS